MNNSMTKKNEQLGMPYGTACNKLRKQVMFGLLKELNRLSCYQCGKKIESVEELSIEHKKPWLDNSSELFWDLNNISFSHLPCNIKASRTNRVEEKDWLHGTINTYSKGCRCNDCKKARHRKYIEYKQSLKK